jgi:GT2 family glycosyltransferase
VRIDGEAPRLTVAIASHQRRESLRRVLEALGRQDYPAERFDVVAVLDGSTDGSAQTARSLELPYRLRLIEQEQRGLAATRNRGAHAAPESAVVVFLDDDIDPQPGFLAAHAEAHAGATGEIAVLGYYPPAVIDEPSLWALRIRAWWEDHFRRKGEPGHQWSYVDFVDGNMSVRRSALFGTGGYDERFRGGRRQDWDLGQRLLQAGIRFEYHPGALGVHRLDPTIEAGLEHARDEGRWDVLLGEKHPQTKGHLPLSRIAWAFERRPRRASILYHPLARRLPTARAGLPALRALEAAGRRGRWWRLSDELLSRAYATGVLDAIPDLRRLRQFLDPEMIRAATERFDLDLEDCAPIQLPPTAAASEVTIRAGGLPLATITGTEPAGQWDPREFTERAVDQAAAAAQLRLGIAAIRPPDSGRVGPG